MDEIIFFNGWNAIPKRIKLYPMIKSHVFHLFLIQSVKYHFVKKKKISERSLYHSNWSVNKDLSFFLATTKPLK